MVSEFTTDWPTVFKDTSVPLVVLPGAPGFKVVPANAAAVGAAVMAWPAMAVMKWVGTSEGDSTPYPPRISPLKPALSLRSLIVFGPIISGPAVSRDTTVPSGVTPETVARKMVPAKSRAFAAAVRV